MLILGFQDHHKFVVYNRYALWANVGNRVTLTTFYVSAMISIDHLWPKTLPKVRRTKRAK